MREKVRLHTGCKASTERVVHYGCAKLLVGGRILETNSKGSRQVEEPIVDEYILGVLRLYGGILDMRRR